MTCMEVVGAVVESAIRSVLTRALNHLGVKSLSEQTQTLRNKKGELIARVNKVNEILQIAEIHGKTLTKDAQNWWNNANTIIHNADVVDKEAHAAKTCPVGFFCTPNCCSRLKLQLKFLKCVEVMDDLLNKASHFSEESLTFLGMEMLTTRLIGSTADKNLKMVWECIVGDEFEKIGVYGMGGVGKTTIMKTISNQLVQQRSRFENVLWVTVSNAVDAQTLQKQIAKVLGLDLSDEQDEDSRSSSLLRVLQRKGKFVLFLDDIWKPFNLHELGVPEPSKDNGCKIVLTTRSREVCVGMLCQKDVKVGKLYEVEAWELFLANVGEELVPEVKEIAKAIVAECCGLPLAIVTIGRAMRRKDVIEWQVALTDLKESTSLNMAMEEKVIQHLKFSYDQLRENQQKCFLYCALYPEDDEIDTSELIGYWVLEGLVKGSSKEDEMRRGHVILNVLKRCCMLEEVSLEGRYYEDGDRDSVKMHDLIRDMALYITKSKPKFMVKAGLSSTEIPHEDDWSEDLERVSFMRSGIKDISITPKCPKLLTLTLAYSTLQYIPPGLFEHMKSLTVLDLSGTLIESLPNSASDLVNLHGLLLIECEKLVRVPSLSKLQSLRVLKLTCSAIKELPQGMEKLVNLRSLDLSRNYILKEMIPWGLISKFSLLQELQLFGIKSEYVYARERGRDFVRELSSLTQLENLQIEFHELSDFIAYGEFGNFERLKKYFIVMEWEDIDTISQRQHERFVWLFNSKGIPCNALSLPKHTRFLCVGHFNEITRLSELPLNDLSDLRELLLNSCNSIEFIVRKEEEGIFLQLIEIMVISQCQSLSKIYEKVPAHGAFPYLKSLTIGDCGNIKILLSSRLLQQLQNLEKIIVENCGELEELIVEEEEEPVEDIGTGIDFTVALPRLKILYFIDLPKLKSIWKGVMVCDSIRKVYVRNCPELKRLPLFNREHKSAFKVIYGSREWWDSPEWDYPCLEHLFQDHFFLELESDDDDEDGCDNDDDDRDDDKEEVEKEEEDEIDLSLSLSSTHYRSMTLYKEVEKEKEDEDNDPLKIDLSLSLSSAHYRSMTL